MAEVNALISAAPNPRARLIIALTVAGRPPGVRGHGPGNPGPAPRFRPTHPGHSSRQGKKGPGGPGPSGAQTALTAATSFGTVGQGRLIDVSRVTVWRWVQQWVS